MKETRKCGAYAEIDESGIKKALHDVDIQLGRLMEKMGKEDILLLTVGHGCDPGFKGTDQSREYVPCLCWGEMLKENVNLGIRKSFADIAQTIADVFGAEYTGDGESFWSLISKK